MTPILVLWVGIALLALAVMFLAWLLTRHTVMRVLTSAPQTASGHTTSRTDRTQPRRAGR